MRVPRPLLLAFVGSLALVESKYVPSIDHDALDTAGTNHPKSPGLAGMQTEQTPATAEPSLTTPQKNTHSPRSNAAHGSASRRSSWSKPLRSAQTGQQVLPPSYPLSLTVLLTAHTPATSTLTSCVSTLTHSICATATSSRPCYPCVMGTPTSSDLATVTMASAPAPPYHTITDHQRS